MSLLEESKTYKPFKYEWAVDMAITSEDMHWVHKEGNLLDDVNQWKSGDLTDVEKNHITQILRLFTQSDKVVGNNYVTYFLPKFKNNEIQTMLLSFANRETEHQRSYALLSDTLGLPEKDYSAFLEYSEMKDKMEFMAENSTATLSDIGIALAKTVFNEGVSLFAAFAMLLNYSRRGKMKGMSEINQWSSRDEQHHCDGMTRLFREFCAEHPRIVNDEFKKAIYENARTCVKLEDKFLDLAYAMGEPEGLTKEEVRQYIRYLADRRLIQMGMKGNWKVKENPLPWMEWMLNGDSHADFFTTRVTDYSKLGLTGDNWGYEEDALLPAPNPA